MSLQRIRDLRRGGHKPAVVWVVLGDKPAMLDDDDRAVIVRATDEPGLMDWRPLIGLVAVLIDVQQQPARVISVLDALQAAGAKVFGAVDSEGVYPLLMDADEAHEKALRKAWEIVTCQ